MGNWGKLGNSEMGKNKEFGNGFGVAPYYYLISLWYRYTEYAADAAATESRRNFIISVQKPPFELSYHQISASVILNQIHKTNNSRN